MSYRVVFSPEAEAHLDGIYDHIRRASGEARAQDVVLQVALACRRLDRFPRRGVSRDDLRPGVRVMGVSPVGLDRLRGGSFDRDDSRHFLDRA